MALYKLKAHRNDVTYIYSEMTFHKDVKAIQFGRDNLLTNGVGKHVDE